MDVGDTFWTMMVVNGVRRRSHLSIILCHIEEAGETLGVTVNVTSNPRVDTTTVLEKGEHPDLTEPQSYVFYAKARKRPLNESQIQKAEAAGLFVRSKKLPFGLIVRILEGAVKSPDSPEWLSEVAEAELHRISF